MICLGANDGCRIGDTGAVQVHYAKGEALYSQGDPADFWFEVVSGVVRTCHFHADGHRHLTGFFYANDVFGIDSGIYQESAEAVTAVVVRRHARSSAAASEGAESQERALRKALRNAHQRIFLLGHRTATERIAAFLVSVLDRGRAQLRLSLPMSRSDIADHLNLTLHTVSRTMSELARSGMIALDGPQNVRILDLDRLRATAGDADPGLGGYMLDESRSSPDLREPA